MTPRVSGEFCALRKLYRYQMRLVLKFLKMVCQKVQPRKTNGFQENSSCTDTNCPVGFQPEAGATIALGDIIEPVSQPSRIKQSITLKVLKDGASGDWLVHCGFNQQQPALIVVTQSRNSPAVWQIERPTSTSAVTWWPVVRIWFPWGVDTSPHRPRLRRSTTLRSLIRTAKLRW